MPRFRHQVARFNLNRDARPLATEGVTLGAIVETEFQSQPRCQAPGDEVITYLPPGSSVFQSQPRCQAPGDLIVELGSGIDASCFNLNRDARPLATLKPVPFHATAYKLFQSQPRCQAPGDT